MFWRVGLLLMLSARVWACMCTGASPSVKQAWQNTPVVFLGTVEMADPDADVNETIFQQQFVRIRVDEAFKGVVIGQTIVLEQAGTDCSAKFRTGERWVFYLYEGDTPGSWSVPFCTHALGSAESGGDDLLFLRGLPKSAIGTRLSGEVALNRQTGRNSSRSDGLSGIPVRISGPKGFHREAVTNSAGVYEVYGLRPGKYSVSIQVPKGLTLQFPYTKGSPRIPGDQATVQIGPNGGASVSFELKDDTSLSGRMLDAAGNPLPHVCFELIRAGDGESVGEFTCSNEVGTFGMKRMPPGKYWLMAKDDIKVGSNESKSTLYYPGTRLREQATVISIEAGKYVENLDVRLPANEKRYRIAGRLQFADGVPAANGLVTFTSPQHGYSQSIGTGKDGVFDLPVVAGMEGELTASYGVIEHLLLRCPEWKVGSRRRGIFRFMDTAPISIAADSDHDGLKLELASPSCKALSSGH